jgi:uncharacterized RDD family membrane protein YckC
MRQREGVAGLALGLLVLIAYPTILEARRGPHNGQTLGKQAVGLRVVRDHDEPLTFAYGLQRELVVRQVVFAAGSSLVFGIPYLLDYLWPLWDESDRTLHDMIVSSHVVRAEPVSA